MPAESTSAIFATHCCTFGNEGSDPGHSLGHIPKRSKPGPSSYDGRPFAPEPFYSGGHECLGLFFGTGVSV